MILLKNSLINLEKPLFRILIMVSLLFFSKEVNAQPPPPRPVKVTATSQELSFGAFTYALVSGTVTVTPAGSRSATGVVLINIETPTSALFNVTGSIGTLVTITYGSDATLSCICGGTLTLHIDASNPGTPFVIEKDFPELNLLYIGGKLTVGNSSTSPPGAYSGTFDITLAEN
jgi:hypothetical protein